MTSIEFKPVGSFSSPLFSAAKSRRVASEVVAASCALYVQQKGFLFVGLTDGKILYWETDSHMTERRSGKESRSRALEEHRGGIKCMTYADSLCNGVMLTGSADRSIKMWDLSDPRASITCVHSLHGHGGTILSLQYGGDMLLSSSTDGLLCIWRDQSPTRLLRFPALSIRQKISQDKPGGASRGAKDLWFLSIALRLADGPAIFAGDSEGYVHILKPDSSLDNDQETLYLHTWKGKIHELGIHKILSVPMESFLFTLSYDQKLKAIDSVTGQVIFEESDPCGVIYNSLTWDTITQDAIVGDGKGNVGFYNMHLESCLVWRSLTKDEILQVHYEPAMRRLLVLSPHACQVFEVVRGIKFNELNEHTGPVVSMQSRATSQGGLLYTASMDNTIRMWDADNPVESIKTLKEKKEEITAMVYLPHADVIITGHENSDIKMWSLDGQSTEARLRMVSGQSVHSNTISCLLCYSDEGGQDGDDGEGRGAETLVAGSYDQQLSFWKVTFTSDGSAMAKLDKFFLAHEDPGDEILAVAHVPLAGAIFTGGNSGIIRKWSVSGVAGELEAELRPRMPKHDDELPAVTCFAVDGAFLFSGSEYGTVHIWEASRGYELKAVKKHTCTVQAVLVLPDSGLVASCAGDGKLCLWDPQVGREDSKDVHCYDKPEEEFRCLGWVELAGSILVGCESGKIIAFPLPSDGSVAQDHQLPKALSGMETPKSAREDVSYAALEALKAAKAKAPPGSPTDAKAGYTGS